MGEKNDRARLLPGERGRTGLGDEMENRFVDVSSQSGTTQRQLEDPES